jgi:hypothetical protein
MRPRSLRYRNEGKTPGGVLERARSRSQIHGQLARAGFSPRRTATDDPWAGLRAQPGAPALYDASSTRFRTRSALNVIHLLGRPGRSITSGRTLLMSS